jgi:hypothetical protein
MNSKTAAMNSKVAATPQQPDGLPSDLHLVGVAASCRLPSEQLPGLRQEVAATQWQTLPEAARQVRKTPCWPRSWGNLHILGQPDTILSRAADAQPYEEPRRGGAAAAGMGQVAGSNRWAVHGVHLNPWAASYDRRHRASHTAVHCNCARTGAIVLEYSYNVRPYSVVLY